MDSGAPLPLLGLSLGRKLYCEVGSCGEDRKSGSPQPGPWKGEAGPRELCLHCLGPLSWMVGRVGGSLRV